ncbi:MAG: sigK [Chthoniobacteraceae bacterium]|nr:sigK [Chthoniobacteraceae bacterium]
MPPKESTADADASLIELISKGDERAFMELYERFSRPLYSLAFKILQNPQDSEDVLQLTFLQIWKKAGSFQSGRATVFTWIVIIMRSKAIDRVRQRLRHNRLAEEQAREHQTTPSAPGQIATALLSNHGAESTTDNVSQQERKEAILKALEKIPSEQRDAIEMAFFKGLTQIEISDALRTPLGTIKARIRRGMLRMRDALEGRV